jgi:hypothetical protein
VVTIEPLPAPLACMAEGVPQATACAVHPATGLVFVAAVGMTCAIHIVDFGTGTGTRTGSGSGVSAPARGMAVTSGPLGFVDGPGTGAQFFNPVDVRFSATGHELLVCDKNSHALRALSVAPVTVPARRSSAAAAAGAAAPSLMPMAMPMDPAGYVVRTACHLRDLTSRSPTKSFMPVRVAVDPFNERTVFVACYLSGGRSLLVVDTVACTFRLMPIGPLPVDCICAALAVDAANGVLLFACAVSNALYRIRIADGRCSHVVGLSLGRERTPDSAQGSGGSSGSAGAGRPAHTKVRGGPENCALDDSQPLGPVLYVSDTTYPLLRRIATGTAPEKEI